MDEYTQEEWDTWNHGEHTQEEGEEWNKGSCRDEKDELGGSAQEECNEWNGGEVGLQHLSIPCSLDFCLKRFLKNQLKKCF